jgi:hypothetical protein
MNRFLILIFFVLGLLGCEYSFDGDPADPLGPNGELIERFNQLQADLVPRGFDLSFQFDEKVSGVEYNAIIVTATHEVQAVDSFNSPVVGADAWTMRINRGNCAPKLERRERRIGVEEWVSKMEGLPGKEYVSHKYLINGQLIYSERSLRSPLWFKVYESPELIPETISSVNLDNPVSAHVAVSDNPWYSHVSWVSRGDGSASRMPIWVQGGIWTLDGHLPVLVAGLVSFKNPKDGNLKPEDMVYVMRLNQSMVVSFRGVLFPVSGETCGDFLSYQNYESSIWSGHCDLDWFVVEKFYDKMRREPLQKIPLDQVWTLTDVVPAPLPKLPEGFVSDFPEFKTPF